MTLQRIWRFVFATALRSWVSDPLCLCPEMDFAACFIRLSAVLNVQLADAEEGLDDSLGNDGGSHLAASGGGAADEPMTGSGKVPGEKPHKCTSCERYPERSSLCFVYITDPLRDSEIFLVMHAFMTPSTCQ